LAFTTPPDALLFGSRLRYAPLQRHTGSRGPNRWERPEGRVPVAGLLSWGSSMPLRRHDRRLRPLPPGPSPRLRRGTATSLARSVLVVPPDLDGFLRRASIRRPRPRRPAGLLRPAAGHGVRQVSVLPYSFWLPADVVGPRFEALSHWRRPFEAFPSPVAASLVTAGPPSREGGCVHRGGVPSRRWVAPTVPCHHGSFVAPSASGPCSTEESVAETRRFRPARPDAPMGFGSNRSDACRAAPARSPRRPAFGRAVPPRRHQSSGRPSPPESGEVGKFLGLSGSERADAGADPKVGGPPVPARWQPEDCYASGPA
jgi:hypothetical protein